MPDNTEADSMPVNSRIPLLKDLPAANKPPISVSRDNDLKDAITIMMKENYSQVPVMQGDKTVHGYVSWRSIGEAFASGKECKTVSDCMDPDPVILDGNKDLLKAIRRIAREDFILVKSKEKGDKIIGIVTTWDITKSFIKLTEPFLLIGKIENNIRQLIDTHVNLEKIPAIQNYNNRKREAKSASDLSFGEYIILLENKENWDRLSKHLISRVKFIDYLKEVKAIRNEVMHFRQIRISDNDTDLLRKMAKFLEPLCKKTEKI